MAVPVDAPLPQLCDLPDGYVVQFAALDPGTGATVSGVTVSNVSIFGTLLVTSATGGTGTEGPFMLVPGPGA